VRKLILALMLSVLLLGFTSFAAAETILLPYVNSNPGNLSTIVSVINTANNVQCPFGFLGTDTLMLHYRYITKPVTAAHIDPCDDVDFNRPTTANDIVSFDISGTVNGGNAMFNDVTNYNGGAGAPRFDLPNQGVIDARRGYMLISHYCSGITNADMEGAVAPYLQDNLEGEAMLLDIVNGAAWGYEAAQSNKALIGPYGFSPIGAGATPAAGMTSMLLPENPALVAAVPFPLQLSWTKLQQVAIYPPDDFQTRFFVTPLYISTAASIANNNMTTIAPLTQKRTRIRLLDASGGIGMVDRDENLRSGGNTVHVRCVAGINLSDLAGSLTAATWYAQQGGWASIQLDNPTVIDPTEAPVLAGDYNAIVWKLEFGAPTFAGGSMINTANVVRDGRIWP
jgi:hypothetical protein